MLTETTWVTWLAGCLNNRYQYCKSRDGNQIWRCMSILNIVQQTGFSQNTVNRIVRRNLKFWKVSNHWVPKQHAVRMMTCLDSLQRCVINMSNFCDKIFRGFTSVGSQNPNFPIDFAGHRYNSAALLCSLWCRKVSINMSINSMNIFWRW